MKTTCFVPGLILIFQKVAQFGLNDTQARCQGAQIEFCILNRTLVLKILHLQNHIFKLKLKKDF